MTEATGGSRGKDLMLLLHEFEGILCVVPCVGGESRRQSVLSVGR